MQGALYLFVRGVDVEDPFADDVDVSAVLLRDILQVLGWNIELERNEMSLFVHQPL